MATCRRRTTRLAVLGAARRGRNRRDAGRLGDGLGNAENSQYAKGGGHPVRRRHPDLPRRNGGAIDFAGNPLAVVRARSRDSGFRSARFSLSPPALLPNPQPPPKMNVTFACPKCEEPARLEIAPDAADYGC